MNIHTYSCSSGNQNFMYNFESKIVILYSKLQSEMQNIQIQSYQPCLMENQYIMKYGFDILIISGLMVDTDDT